MSNDHDAQRIAPPPQQHPPKNNTSSDTKPTQAPMLNAETARALHAKLNVASGGASLHDARAVVICLHGRGATAASILELGRAIGIADVAYLAPQAPRGSWYPSAFTAPRAANEPALTDSLRRVSTIIDDLSSAGVPDHALVLMGFSQGACLATESVIIRARPLGGLLAFSGGYIGEPGPPRQAPGRLTGLRAFLGCSDIDPHIPLARVLDTTRLLTDMGAQVTERIYPGFGHAINDDEQSHARTLLSHVLEMRKAIP